MIWCAGPKKWLTALKSTRNLRIKTVTLISSENNKESAINVVRTSCLLGWHIQVTHPRPRHAACPFARANLYPKVLALLSRACACPVHTLICPSFKPTWAMRGYLNLQDTWSFRSNTSSHRYNYNLSLLWSPSFMLFGVPVAIRNAFTKHTRRIPLVYTSICVPHLRLIDLIFHPITYQRVLCWYSFK